LVQVRAVRELVQQLPDFKVTPYSQLAEVRAVCCPFYAKL
jgi:hypothetical protein